MIRAIGARQASRYFLTAERISAREAKQIGLAHEVADAEDLDRKVQEMIDALLLVLARSSGIKTTHSNGEQPDHEQ